MNRLILPHLTLRFTSFKTQLRRYIFIHSKETGFWVSYFVYSSFWMLDAGCQIPDGDAGYRMLPALRSLGVVEPAL